MKPYDILIVGGGVIGTAVARELSKYKIKIALLEKEVELAFGVSKSNSGIIHPGTQTPPRSLKGRLCLAGNRLLRSWAQELGVHFKEVGELIVAFREEERAVLQRIQQDAESLGVLGLKIVDRAWLAEHEPNLNPEVKAALYAPSAGIVSPYRLVYDLAENAQQNGVDLFLQHPVSAIRPGRGYFEVVSSGSTVFRARVVINAAGLYADEVARLVGIQDIVIHPRKGEEYLLDKKRENLTRHLLFPLPTPTSKGILIIKSSDGNPIIGPTAEPAQSKEDLGTTDAGLAKILASVQKMVPTIQRRDIIAYFAGLRPVAGDDFIIRHEAALPGFINVAGIQSPGLTAAPAIALMVRDLVRTSGLTLAPKRRFQRHRKPSVHLFSRPLSSARALVRKDPAYGDIVCRCELVSAREIRDAIQRGARTLDGIKFRTRAQAGRCHGGFCTTRIMKILAEELGQPPEALTKRGPGSEIIAKSRDHDPA